MSATLQQAAALHQSGRFAEAQALYQRILTADPSNADALHLLGVLAHQTGQHAPAEALIRRALARQPNAFLYHNSFGNVLRATGRAAEAEAAYRAALRLQPNSPEVQHHLGLALLDQHRPADAETAFRHAIRMQKDFVPARVDLTNLLVAAGRGADAEACIRPALRATPNNHLALNALGLALAAQGKHGDALTRFDAALAAAPGYSSAQINRAASLLVLERYEEAAAGYEAALAAAPGASDLKLGLARAQLQLKRGDGLEKLFRELLADKPNDPELLHGLVAALSFQDRMADALVILQATVKRDPTHARAWHDIGMCLRDLVRWPASLAPFAEAVRLEPDNAEYNASYSYALLAVGNYEAAWPHFEWRVKKTGNARLAEPMWDGTQTDKTVLIHAEQGLGDTIQFCRFVPVAAQRARIILACPKSLYPLLAQMPGIADAVSAEPIPPYDMQCPVMSLPSVLGITADHFADTVPYLPADPAKVATWRARFAGLPGRKIGVVWSGNPKYPADRRRSLPFATLAPLFTTPNTHFISLQIGDARATMPEGAMLEAAPWIGDFTDTAAAMMALDLIISVDTSAAHLAGALGQQVWMLNRADTDWRWLIDRADTPWYPTMRIFRQPRPGDWAGVIAQVAVALDATSEKKKEFLF
jgi:tetratricopeptide (TPR) repeat protein